ncbi:hypothetical protein CB1_000726125 [Camelus ferus]|nr:hypothetical protein CB1_000726125 [Camelus ferus]
MAAQIPCGLVKSDMMTFTLLRKSCLPSAVRSLILQKKPNIRNMSSSAEGLQPASVVVLPRSLALAFEKFCQANSGPLPLLGRSEPGKWTLPALGAVPDTRMGCPQFRKYEFGTCMGSLTSLEECSEQLKDMVAFLLGRSFSLEGALEEAGLPGRNAADHGHLGAYKTAVPCATIAGFCCPLVVTMRPVPKDKLERLVQASCSAAGEQGQPVHIGDPGVKALVKTQLPAAILELGLQMPFRVEGLLGIKDLSKPDYGEPVVCQPGDVPVFWPSQLTSLEAVSGCSKSGLVGAVTLTEDEFSMASASAVRKIRELETMIAVDPDELLRASLSLSHARSLLLTTGLPTHFNHEPPEETDGPPGAVALAAFLQALEKRVCMVVDRRALSLYKKLVDEAVEQGEGGAGEGLNGAKAGALRDLTVIWLLICSLPHGPTEVAVTAPEGLGVYPKLKINLSVLCVTALAYLMKYSVGILKTRIPLLTYQGGSTGAAQAFLCADGDPKSPRFDHLVAIERVGRAADGNYYNARMVSIRHLVDPIDELFLAAQKIPGISSTGVGDGGNELGMGKVKEAVKRHIRNGDVIACDVEADFAVIAGVSNWGGYALACALYILNSCEVHSRYLRKAVGPFRAPGAQSWTQALPSVAKEEKMLSILVRHRVRSGVSGLVGMEVDGLRFHDTHAQMIQKLVDVTTVHG